MELKEFTVHGSYTQRVVVKVKAPDKEKALDAAKFAIDCGPNALEDAIAGYGTNEDYARFSGCLLRDYELDRDEEPDEVRAWINED